MKFLKKIICIVILPGLYSSVAFSLVVDNNKALQLEKKYLNKRYKGYYKHVEAYKAYQKLRLKKVKDHKKKRINFETKRIKKRNAFIKNRKKVKKKKVDLDAIMAKLQKQRDKKRNKLRLRFIRNKKTMEKLKQTTKKIPEDIDTGLRTLDQTSPR